MTVVFRVVKTKNYTMISNQHLKDKRLTLKAKGLMSVMLSLPENWDYTLRGLSAISKEGVDAISEAVKELERSGYVIRNRKRDERGRLSGTEYLIYEDCHMNSQPRRTHLSRKNQNGKIQDWRIRFRKSLCRRIQSRKNLNRKIPHN